MMKFQVVRADSCHVGVPRVADSADVIGDVRRLVLARLLGLLQSTSADALLLIGRTFSAGRSSLLSGRKGALMVGGFGELFLVQKVKYRLRGLTRRHSLSCKRRRLSAFDSSASELFPDTMDIEDVAEPERNTTRNI
jgi:hypothetical protein